MNGGDSRPAQMALINAAAGGEVTVTVPDGEVWEVLCLSGTYGGDSPAESMLVAVSNGSLTCGVFTFNTTTVGNNSFVVNCYIVLDAGHTLTLVASELTTFANLVVSGRATTIY